MQRTPNRDGRRLILCIGLGLAACLAGAGAAHAQLAEGGDIPWEAEWAALAPVIGATADTADLDSDQVYDVWEFSLAEKVISDPGTAGHQASQVSLFNTTYTTLLGENPALAAAYGNVCTLAILRGRFADANSASVAVNSISLTPGLYSSLPVVAATGDPDGDTITNQQEFARDSANYVAQATTPARSYRFGSPTELLDAAFYASGLQAWEGTLNNSGTTAAFYAVDGSFQVAIYLVDLGDPSSWRALTGVIPDAAPEAAIAWTPDDSALLVANARIPLNSGAIIRTTMFGYALNDVTVTALPNNNWAIIHGRTPAVASEATVCQGGDLAYEFDAAGDAEGWAPYNSLSALTVSEGLLHGAITGDDPWMGTYTTPFAAAANPYVAIKMKTSYGGTFSFFWQNDVDGLPYARGKTLGPQNQFNIYVFTPADLGGNWTGNITGVRLDPSDNLTSGSFDVEFIRLCSGSDYTGGGENLIALPILADGSADVSREPVVVTNFTSMSFPGDKSVDWPNVSPDGSRISFAAYSESNTPGVPDGGDIYVIDNVAAILAAPKIPGTDISSLAPSGLSDPRVIPVRAAGGSEPDYYAETPSFTQDNQLVLYSEDISNTFRNADFFGSLDTCDVSIMISQADGNGRDFRVDLPGNQIAPSLSRGGTRVLYATTILDVLDFHLFIANLESETPVMGTVLPNNDLLTSVEQTTSDSSGTDIVLPAGLTIDFPVGEPQAIQITTPIDPVQVAQLPPDAGIDAIPVVRAFGPSGTNFSTPIAVTISYTDAEVAGLDEANIKIFLYSGTAFDIPVTTIIGRDLINNTITFTVDHFSVFGLGAELDTDGDGLADSVDPDDDNDGILDANDLYPLDTDNDGINNLVDPDDDSDGIVDSEDAYPLDTNNNGVPNAVDSDDDSDGIPDTEDLFLFDTDNDGLRNAVEWIGDGTSLDPHSDVDGDGVANSLDTDSDDDGVLDAVEHTFGYNPYDAGNTPELPLPWWPMALVLALAGVSVLNGSRAFRRLTR